MTTPIPAGTCNVPLNLLVEERSQLQKLAYARGLSVNEYLRRIIRRGIAFSNPFEAKTLAKFRRSRAVALLALFLSWMVLDGGEMKKSRRTKGRRDVEIEDVWSLGEVAV